MLSQAVQLAASETWSWMCSAETLDKVVDAIFGLQTGAAPLAPEPGVPIASRVPFSCSSVQLRDLPVELIACTWYRHR